MKFLSYIFALSLTSSFASTRSYDLKLDIRLNGEQSTAASALVEAGKPTTILQTKDGKVRFIQVVANEGELLGKKGILMNFEIGYIQKNGGREILSKAQILASEGKKAMITLNERETKEETLRLSVIATEI